MDTTISQVGSNVANQFTKLSEAPITERVQKIEISEDITADNSNLKVEQNLLAVSAENTQAISREADITAREASAAEFEQALGDVNNYLQSTNRQLSFSIDEAADRSVVTVTDANSGDVIRQIPSEEVLKFAERVNELQSEFGNSTGNLLREQA